MRDVQNESDDRNLAIDRVGISGISWPISVPDRENGVQETVAEVSLSVSLPQDYRGTHMSRFIEVLSAQEKKVTFHNMEGLLANLKERLHAEDAHAVFDFPYFITKSAPVSGSRGRVRCDVRFDAAMLGGDFDLVTTVVVPVQTLCPCSKEISEFGAHNQRAHASISVRLGSFVWLEEFIEAADKCASAPIYSLLKREDEKYEVRHGARLHESALRRGRGARPRARDAGGRARALVPRFGDEPRKHTQSRRLRRD